MKHPDNRQTSRSNTLRRWIWPLGLTGVIAVGTAACYELQPDTPSTPAQAEASSQNGEAGINNQQSTGSSAYPQSPSNGTNQQSAEAQLSTNGQQINGYRSNYHFTVPDKWKK
ncbi:protein SCAI-like protein [Corchorus olitorius]|uniref:Protein SCAI-like protein n=1 Tax=Corchorus olitorius TaxID=93759 RepID=A0A1R3GBQ5_9ROSI|nr:protein SCAI-like protein [Corchorus olitorius]